MVTKTGMDQLNILLIRYITGVASLLVRRLTLTRVD